MVSSVPISGAVKGFSVFASAEVGGLLGRRTVPSAVSLPPISPAAQHKPARLGAEVVHRTTPIGQRTMTPAVSQPPISQAAQHNPTRSASALSHRATPIGGTR
ncbi:hypothetical protein VSH64_20240 [Amycolatopsis rhabdoformis]|uniref:Uncharacterized protein n=1 Tax=Amycolatopsis rhabdoformis TaxID=1448059 RepID=A0ABZ1ILM1_9PSEU|nr:hypothetical protein [Amycolatopsis rhabdoformis]WSE34390.1 hypothetical protein VSH64_20240 [Amycolatopsis rhabdoformis]